MRTKLIAAAMTLTAAAAIGVAIASTSSTASETPPGYTKLTIDLADAPRTKALAKPAPGSSKKPEIVYLQGAATTIDPSDPPVGLSPFVDVKLTGCSKVIDGGIVPKDTTNLFIQGSYVKNSRQYHVLIALDDGAASASPRASFTITSNLTCLKGVK